MPRSSRYVLAALVAAVGAAFLVGAAAPPPATSAQTATTFSGQATALKGSVAGAGLLASVFPCKAQKDQQAGFFCVADTGPLDETTPTPPPLEASVLCYAVPDTTGCAVAPSDLTGNTVNAEVLHAAVVAGGDTSRAEAYVANFNLNVAGHQIGADVLDSRAQATCTGNGAVVKAGSQTSVTVDGTTYTVGTTQEQTITLPSGTGGASVGYVTINGGASAPRSGDTIDAYALHVVLDNPLTGENLVNLYVAAVHADIHCAALLNCPSSQHSFVTGGGFISLPDVAKAHFAVAGRHMTDWGHVLYKPTRLHVHNPSAVVYTSWSRLHDAAIGIFPAFTAAQSQFALSKFEGGAIITWPAADGGSSVSGGPTAGEVLALDFGEPGRSDFFELVGAGATPGAGGGFLKGGNIQMHGKCPVTP